MVRHEGRRWEMRLDGERRIYLEDPIGLIEDDVRIEVDGQVQHDDEIERMNEGSR
jgi:hypothetical protein